MSTEMIPVKKLSDSIVGDFYPLAADKGTIFTEDIPVRGNIGDYVVGDVIHKADSLFDVISKLVGPNGYDDRYILKTSIDVTELTNDTNRVPCSKLVKTKLDELYNTLIEIIKKTSKHELLSQEEYERRLVSGEIADDVIYMTYGSGPVPPPEDTPYIITEDSRNIETEDGQNLLISEQDPETNNILTEESDNLHSEDIKQVIKE